MRSIKEMSQVGIKMILSFAILLTTFSPIYASSSMDYQSDSATNPDLQEVGTNIFSDYVPTKLGVHKIHNSRASWNVARNVCLDENAQLVVIDSAAEEAMLKKHMKANGMTDIWIGVHDLFGKRQWTTITGDKLYTLDYVHWGYGEPNGSGADERCVELNFNGLNDLACDREMGFVCEKLF